MTDGLKATRLSKAVREFNVGMTTIVEFLQKKGFEVDSNPNFKIPSEAYALLLKEYSSDLSVKKESEKLILNELSRKKESVTLDQESGEVVEEIVEQEPVSKAPVEETPAKEEVTEEKAEVKTETSEPAKATEEKKEEPKEKAKEKTEPKEKAVVKAKEVKEDEPKKGLGPTVVGKIDLDKVQKPRKAASKDKGKAEEKAIQRQLDQAEQRFEVGLAAITDVHEARATFDGARARVIVANNSLEDANEALFEIAQKYYPELVSSSLVH